MLRTYSQFIAQGSRLMGLRGYEVPGMESWLAVSKANKCPTCCDVALALKSLVFSSDTCAQFCFGCCPFQESYFSCDVYYTLDCGILEIANLLWYIVPQKVLLDLAGMVGLVIELATSCLHSRSSVGELMVPSSIFKVRVVGLWGHAWQCLVATTGLVLRRHS